MCTWSGITELNAIKTSKAETQFRWLFLQLEIRFAPHGLNLHVGRLFPACVPVFDTASELVERHQTMEGGKTGSFFFIND